MYRIMIPVIAILFVLLWSSGWTASHYAVADSSTLSILSARYVIVVLLLLFIVTFLRQWQRIPPREIMFHLLIGALCHALYLLGSVSAFELGVSAAIVAFINALQPMVTASMSGVMTGEHLRARHFTGLVLGVLSVILVVSDSYYESGVSFFALALPFLAMLALCTGLILKRRQELKATALKHKSRPVMLLLLVHTFGAMLVIVPLSAMHGDLHWQFTSTQWSAIAWLAVMVSLASYALLIVLLRHISAVRVSSLTYLVPPVTMMQSYFVFGEKVTVTDAIALCITGIAVYLILTNSRTTSTRPTGPKSAVRLISRIKPTRHSLSSGRFSGQLTTIDIEL